MTDGEVEGELTVFEYYSRQGGRVANFTTYCVVESFLRNSEAALLRRVDSIRVRRLAIFYFSDSPLSLVRRSTEAYDE